MSAANVSTTMPSSGCAMSRLPSSPDLPVYVDADGSTDTHNPIRTGCMKPNRYDY